jgi:hypothetical protein
MNLDFNAGKQFADAFARTATERTQGQLVMRLFPSVRQCAVSVGLAHDEQMNYGSQPHRD